MSSAPEQSGSSGAAPKREFRARLRRKAPAIACSLLVALLSGVMWVEGATVIEDFSSSLLGIRRLVSGDSEHYLAIADAFREGDFRMTHVEPTGSADRAHRQPGYPALLALAMQLGVEGAPALARVNLAVLVATLWIAYFGARVATGSALAALLAVSVIYGARFLFDIATERLLTEPLYVAVSTAAVAACFAYLQRATAAALLATAALAAAAYLVRVNGLLLAAALAFALVAADLYRARLARPSLPSVDLVLHLPLGAYATALALFLTLALPSWLPRSVYTGNPVYHGYLTNYLWVDDYDRAHQPGPARYSMKTYTSEHDVGDAAWRLGYGLRHVFYDTPRDKFGIVASIALLGAVVVIFTFGDRASILLLWAGVLQALPLAWTALPNPARRMPAAALLPFAAILVAAAAALLLRQLRSRF